MPLRTETAIIGAGQAGLALSRCLTERSRPHVLLERARVAERWRSERWDSFRLLTPNWHTRLPGHRYAGDDPDGFMRRDEVVSMFTAYARSFGAPVLDDITATRLDGTAGGWRVTTDRGTVRATNVVVATGPHGHAHIPAVAGGLPPGITQVHSSRYRRPDQLPPGAVLVVGAGPTGQQLASELARAGRTVHLAVGRHVRMPRTYRGRDAFWWMDRTGASEEVVDPNRPEPRPSHPVLAADRDLGLDELVADGVQPTGRLLRADGGRLTFAGDLLEHHQAAESARRRFTATVDAHIARTGLDAPPAEPDPPAEIPTWATSAPLHLDIRSAGITTVLWATGFRRRFSWLPSSVLDARGEPVHRRGVTRADGLFFLGLSWLHRRASASIDGVGADARYLAEVIDRRTSRAPATRAGYVAVPT